MSKNSIDFAGLEHKISHKTYKLSEIKDQIEKVAFDIVRFKDADKGTELWQVQSADDGEYIVALYDEEDEAVKVASNWSVYLTKTAANVQISYKNDPIATLSYIELGIPKHEITQVANYLPEKLATNKKLVSTLLNQLNDGARKEVFKRYPELA